MTRTVLPRLGVSSWGSDADAWPGRTGWDAELANLNDKVAIWGQGTTAARPTAGYAGRFFFATDSLRLYYDDGTAWTEASPVGGGGAPTVITAGDIAAEGSSRIGARADHAHALPAPAVDPATVNYGGSAARGSSGTLARADHTHALPALPALPLATTTPPAVGATGAVGTSTSVARADHTHAGSTPAWGGAWTGTASTPPDTTFRSVPLTAAVSGETLNSATALTSGRVVVPYTGIYAGIAHAYWPLDTSGRALCALDLGSGLLTDFAATIHVVGGHLVVPFSKRLTAGNGVTCSTYAGGGSIVTVNVSFYIHLVALG